MGLRGLQGLTRAGPTCLTGLTGAGLTGLTGQGPWPKALHGGCCIALLGGRCPCIAKRCNTARAKPPNPQAMQKGGGSPPKPDPKPVSLNGPEVALRSNARPPPPSALLVASLCDARAEPPMQCNPKGVSLNGPWLKPPVRPLQCNSKPLSLNGGQQGNG
jgi:hypothetical protein